MFIPERYRRYPPARRPATAAAETPTDDAADSPPEPDDDEPTDLDEPEDAELSDADFLRELRADAEGLRAGTVPAFSPKPVLTDWPWGRRHKRRDRYGRPF